MIALRTARRTAVDSADDAHSPMAPRADEVPTDVGAALVVDLDALIANYRTIGRLTVRAEVAAVLKADAYGLGVATIAPALHTIGCRCFFVALAREAIELRELLPEVEIAVLNGPDVLNAPLFAAHRLRPVINNLDQLAVWQALCQSAPTTRRWRICTSIPG